MIAGLIIQFPLDMELQRREMLLLPGGAGRLSNACASASMHASPCEAAGCAAPPGHVHVIWLAAHALSQLPPKALRCQRTSLPQLLTAMPEIGAGFD